MDTVPNKVDQLFRALQHHDRRTWQEALSQGRPNQPRPDFLTPIIADGDTGHGGLTAVMRLVKMFIEAGAAGIHFEDQASTRCLSTQATLHFGPGQRPA